MHEKHLRLDHYAIYSDAFWEPHIQGRTHKFTQLQLTRDSSKSAWLRIWLQQTEAYKGLKVSKIRIVMVAHDMNIKWPSKYEIDLNASIPCLLGIWTPMQVIISPVILNFIVLDLAGSRYPGDSNKRSSRNCRLIAYALSKRWLTG